MPNSTATTIKQKRAFMVEDCYKGFGPKIIESILRTIGEIDKQKNVIELDEFPNEFLVRAGKFGNELYLEQKNGITANLGYIRLSVVGHPEKKIDFAVWRRYKSSAILR
ncbi:hypothetical protein IT400_02950 [Candidatus Nomurabacteria bacterium]|nr:hypothetical protein [Candidatus Nomurabacteria bacterium]